MPSIQNTSNIYIDRELYTVLSPEIKNPVSKVTVILPQHMDHIQFIEGEELRERAQKEVVREMSIPAERGNIYSSDGKLLATIETRSTIIPPIG